MTRYCIGVDLGGAKIAAGLVDLATGEVSGRSIVPTESHEGQEAVIDRMAELVGAIGQAAIGSGVEVEALGVGVPGVVDLERRRTLFLPNLPGAWRDVPLGAELQRLSRFPTWLINDARAFTLAEALAGAGRGARSVVGVTIGTGIGGGIVVDGQLFTGIDGSAGELGHQTIDPHGPPCGCGNYGCLEAFASGPAITALGVRVVLQGGSTQIGALVDHDLNRITPETIMRAAELGDEVAVGILQRTGEMLGVGVANLATILCPDRIVLGGGVMRLGEWLLKYVRATVRRRCYAVPIHRMEIAPAELGVDAGIIGAAMWAGQQRTAANARVGASQRPAPFLPSGEQA